MTLSIATSSNEEFLPGVIALHNSIKTHMPNTQLTVFAYGDNNFFSKLKDRNISIIENLKVPVKFPDQILYGKKVQDNMYSRLFIPEHLDGRVLYMDADAIMLNSVYELNEMNLNGNPHAAVYRGDIGWSGGPQKYNLASGIMLFDTEKWRKEKLTERAWDILKTKPAGYRGNVETLTSETLQGRYFHLPIIYHNLAYYGNLIQDDKLLHIATRKPWNVNEKVNHEVWPLNYIHLWRAYNENNIKEALDIQKRLPIERKYTPKEGEKRKFVQL